MTWADKYPAERLVDYDPQWAENGVRSAIGHLFTDHQWRTAHPRLFADWLRTHESDRARYADLKRDLVSRGIWNREYTDLKSGFVLAIVNRARASRGLQPVSGPM